MECYRQSGRGRIEVGFMTCYQHPSMPAAARCEQCGKEICAACATHVGDKTVCRDCADIMRSDPAYLRSQPVPVAEAPQPEGQVPAEAPAQSVAPVHADAEQPEEPPKETPPEKPKPPVSEPSTMPVPVTPSSVATVPRPVPLAPVTPDPGAGGRREKEPLLSAALSLILPGAGQVYNGQMAKGLVLAVIYLSSIAVIGSGMIITALSTGRNSAANSLCCCCLPLFIVPVIVLVYAIYDAYDTADKINFDKPVREWP